MQRRPNRAGYTLILFVMMFFGLMGLAALVIDLGFARLAQQQMQSAADTAALEGLRWRDVQKWNDLPPGWLTNASFEAAVPGPYTGTISPAQADTIRRWAASQAVANLFSNGTDATGETVYFGAGPVVNFSGGVGPQDLAAGELMTQGSPPVYQPVQASGTPGLELNQSATNYNAVEGDMVAGTYGQNSSYQPSASDPQGLGDENDAYGRRDFQNTGAAPLPAFLVRMRRTKPPPMALLAPNALDSEAGISSSGPTLPLLFGYGSLMARNSSGGLSAASGIAVRATTIAAAGPIITSSGTYSVGSAMTVGRPNAAYSLPGSLSAQLPGGSAGVQLYCLVIYLSQWKSLAAGSATTAVVSDNWTLRSSDGTIIYGYVADGSAVDPTNVSPVYPNGRPLLGSAAMLGDQAQPVGGAPAQLAGSPARWWPNWRPSCRPRRSPTFPSSRIRRAARSWGAWSASAMRTRWPRPVPASRSRKGRQARLPRRTPRPRSALRSRPCSPTRPAVPR